MAVFDGSNGNFTVRAYAGDSKTLLAFNFSKPDAAKNLAGFTIHCQPPSNAAPYYLSNELRFQNPAKHAQITGEPPNSTANAPIQKYRWTAFPGLMHGGLQPPIGNYVYTITPRYFDGNGSMLAMDPSLAAKVTVPMGPFVKGSLALGFTRGYMQSEAYAHHFGQATPIEPANRPLQYNTSAKAGSNSQGQDCSFAQIYDWMGASARRQIFSILNEVLNDPTLSVDVFAYDLDEPDIVTIFLSLAAQGRIRMILDDAQLHVEHNNPKTHKSVIPLEVPFAQEFAAKAESPAELVRGCFDRFSHDKILIVSKAGSAIKVLTGSTNFSVTGLYVNANHVLVFDDPGVAQHYAQVFEQSWTILKANSRVSEAAASAFANSLLAEQPFTPASKDVPKLSITFSPHTLKTTDNLLAAIANRVESEAKASNGSASRLASLGFQGNLSRTQRERPSRAGRLYGENEAG